MPLFFRACGLTLMLRRLIALSCLLTILCGSRQTVVGAPPTNDVCSGAEIIPFNATFPYLTAVTDLSQATTNGDPPAASCAVGGVSHSLWYVFAPKETGFYTISSCANAPTATTLPDTLMAIYTSSGGCGGVLTELPSSGSSLGCADDSCGPGFRQAAITTQLLADSTYYVVVWQFGGAPSAPGNSSVQLRISKATPPSNDTGAGVSDVFLNLPVIGSTILAHNDYELEEGSSCFTGIGQKSSTASGRDVVYRFTAPAAGNYSIKVSYYNNSSPYDLVVYAASALPSGPGPATVTTCLGGANRSDVSSAEEILCLPLAINQQIFIFVDEDVFSPQGSSFLLEVTRCLAEAETNNTIATASPYVFGIEGSINPGNDHDFYALGLFPQNARAFVMVDGSAGNATEFDLQVVTDSGTVLEYDDKDNDDPFGSLSPNIAGVMLSNTPTYLEVYNRLGRPEEPYRVYAVVQPPLSFATPENEAAPFNQAANNYFYGTLQTNAPPAAPSPSTDVDLYQFDAEMGTLVFVSLDGNPNRGNKPINAQLALLDGSGNLLIKVDDSSISQFPGEALVYRVEDDGNYFVRVSISPNATSANGAGDYLLSITKNGLIGACACNNAPVFASVGFLGPVYQSFPAILSGSLVDYDVGQWHQLTITWGDGSPNTITNLPPGTGYFNLSHLYTQLSSSVPVKIMVMDPLNASASSNLTVSVQSQPVSARVLDISQLPNGHILLHLVGSPLATYRVETSTDLITWTDLTSATADVSGLFQIEDSTSPLFPQSFYRAIWP